MPWAVETLGFGDLGPMAAVYAKELLLVIPGQGVRKLSPVRQCM